MCSWQLLDLNRITAVPSVCRPPAHPADVMPGSLQGCVTQSLKISPFLSVQNAWAPCLWRTPTSERTGRQTEPGIEEAQEASGCSQKPARHKGNSEGMSTHSARALPSVLKLASETLGTQVGRNHRTFLGDAE